MTAGKERSKSKSKNISKSDSKVDLLDDGQTGDNLEFTINPKFARDYEDRKRRQEIGRARELGLLDKQGNPILHDHESEDSETDDDGFALTANIERQIAKTIEAIRNKDASVYDSAVNFFDATEAKEEEGAGETKLKKKKRVAKDVIRDQLLEAAESGKLDAFDEDEDDFIARKRMGDDGDRTKTTRMYDEEQVKLREAFISKVDGSASDSEDDFLQVRKVLSEDEDDDVGANQDLSKFLRTKKGKPVSSAEEIKDPEAFLQAFVTNRSWNRFEREEEDHDPFRGGAKYGKAPKNLKDIMDEDDADEEAIARADEFESS